MNFLHKYFLIILLKMLITNVSSSIILPEADNEDLNFIRNEVMMILNTCYPDEKSIVVCDTTDNDLIGSLWVRKSIGVILYNSSAIFPPHTRHLDKKNLFVALIKSHHDFKKTLQFIQNTPWWNKMATFLFLNYMGNGCLNAESVLKAAWEQEIPTTIFLCRDSQNIASVYTYNPYTNRAPSPWSEMEITKPIGDPWSLFSHPLHTIDKNICDSFNFDRARYLDGYPIKASLSIMHKSSLIEKKNRKLSSEDKLFIYLLKSLQYVLNSTLLVHPFKLKWNESDKVYDGLNEGTYDVSFSGVPMHSIKNFTPIHPVFAMDLVVVSFKRGYYSPEEKISKFYGQITFISLIIILNSTFFVIAMTNRTKSKSFAVFETLRLLVNNPLRIQIRTLSQRIFFFVIFIYFIIIQATFSGNLPSFLTKKTLRECPKTESDLLDDSVKIIYVPRAYSIDFIHPKLNDKIILIDTINCEFVIGNDTSSVCISSYDIGVKLSASDSHFYVSDESLGMNHLSFIARHNWPLKHLLDLTIIKFTDFGFSEFTGKKYIEDDVKKIKRRVAKTNIKFRPIKLKDLQFIFRLWTIGIITSVVIFIIEFIFRGQH